MANRLANATDVSNFLSGSTDPVALDMYYRDPLKHRAVQLNDIVIDSKNLTNSVFYNAIATDFSGARFGFTVWIKPMNVAQWRFGNNDTLWTGKGSTANRNMFRMLGVGQLRIRRTTGYNTTTFEVRDLEYIDARATRDDRPAISNDWGSYLYDSNFPIVIDSENFWDNGAIGITFDGQIKELLFGGFSVRHMFAAARLFNNHPATRTVDLLHMEDLFFAQGIDGEGIYSSTSTGTPPYTLFNNHILRNVIITGRALEGLQLQHWITPSENSIMENVVIHGSSAAWRGEQITAGQNKGFQLYYDSGGQIVRNCIIDGAAADLLMLQFGTAGTPDRSNRLKFQNTLFINSRYEVGYFQTDDAITPIEFDNCDLGVLNGELLEGSSLPPATAHINITNDVEVIARNTTYESGYDLFTGQLARTNISNNTATTLIQPDYVNAGIPWDCEIWYNVYAPILDTNGAITYKAGKTILNVKSSTKNGRYYRCLIQNTTNASDDTINNPTNSPTLWKILTWDTAGLPCDHASWNSGTAQSNNPPWDFRLKKNSYHNVKRRGLVCNEDNDGKSYYIWEKAFNNGSNLPDLTTVKRCFSLKNIKHTEEEIKSEVNVNDFVRVSVIGKTATGRSTSLNTSTWIQVS